MMDIVIIISSYWHLGSALVRWSQAESRSGLFLALPWRDRLQAQIRCATTGSPHWRIARHAVRERRVLCQSAH